MSTLERHAILIDILAALSLWALIIAAAMALSGCEAMRDVDAQLERLSR